MASTLDHIEPAPNAPSMSPEAVAAACAESMWSTDHASQALGITLVDVSPGYARLAMAVRPDMLNGHGICHGGPIATLADSAFGFACNSHGIVSVASGFDIDFLAPAHLGDLLVAEARETARRGRSGIYDVTVRRDDHVIAEYRGRSRSLGRAILAAD